MNTSHKQQPATPNDGRMTPAASRAPRISRQAAALACATAVMLLFFGLNLFIGSVDVPAAAVVDALMGRCDNEAWRFIVVESRLVQAVTALLSGAALAVAGLMLQTCFANPLADTSILGVNAGANLGVAVAFLLLGGSFAGAGMSLSGFALVLAAAFCGAAVVLALLTLFATLLRSNLALLIAGIMVSYVTSALITVLSTFATAEGVHSYVFWGMGNFGGVPPGVLPWYAAVIVAGLVGAAMTIKPLDAMLLGDNYAANLGIAVRRVRVAMLAITGVLGAAVTAFCGPVAFVGLAVPHVARFLAATVNHRALMPLTAVCGAAAALVCNFICNALAPAVFLPLNAVTSLLGVPVILYVIFCHRRSAGLN